MKKFNDKLNRVGNIIFILILAGLLILAFTSCKTQELITVYNTQLIDIGGHIKVDKKIDFIENLVAQDLANKLGIDGKIKSYDCYRVTWTGSINRSKLKCKQITLIPVKLHDLNRVNSRGRIIIKNKYRNTFLIDYE